MNHLRSSVVLAVLAAFATTPAAASAQAPDVRPGHTVAIFNNLDFVAATGYGLGTPMRVDVYRGPHRIGSAHGSAVGTAAGPGLEVNHGPAGAAGQGDCWDGLTPNVRPGDRIVVSGDGGQDTVFVDRIVIDEVAAGTAPGDENVYVRGVARYADGTPIPPDLLDSGEVRSNGGSTRANPTQPVKRIGDPAGDAWEAVYEAPDYGVFRGTPSKSAILNGVHAMGYGHIPIPPPPVIQLVDGPETPGPALGCETLAPAAPANAIMTTDDEAINLTSGAVTLGGVAGDTVTGVDVTLSIGGTVVSALPENVSLTPEAGGTAWTATFTRDQLESPEVADGMVTATAAFTGAGPATHSRTILKDLQAPGAPTADPPAGTYFTGPLVRLFTADAADVVRFTRNDTQPTPASPTAAGFVRVAASQTLTAMAIDRAGNAGPAKAFEYVITEPPPAEPAAQQPQPAPSAAAPELAPLTTPAAPPAPLATPPAARPLKVSSLTATPRIARARVRGEGIRALMRLPAGAEVVRLRIHKRSGATRRLIATRFVVPSRPGRFRVRLHDRALRNKLLVGRYELEVTPGTTRDALGSPSRTAFTVVRSL